MRAVIDSDLFSPLYENMRSSTKPEVHNVCRQRRTEPRPQVAGTENLTKFGQVVFEICEWTDKQTERQTDRQRQTDIVTLIVMFCTPTGAK